MLADYPHWFANGTFSSIKQNNGLLYFTQQKYGYI